MLLPVLFCLSFLTPPVGAPDPPASPSISPSGAVATDPTVAFFEGAPRSLSITVDAEAAERLRAEPRRYVRATLTEGDQSLDVAVKLKGAAGSFREFDDQPALTIAVDRFKPEQRFHGLARFHLNNSVQDPTLLNEWLGSEIFREAGIPATRVTHARLRLNGRDLGVYVLKESFDQAFLARHFAQTNGNLYDGGLLQDIDAELELDGGSGPKDRSDLRAIIEAREAANRSEDRREGVGAPTDPLAERLDIDAFLRFVAVERLVGHWDGYAGSANNYRLYFDPARQGRAVFLPHGLDQLFEDPSGPMYGESPTLLGSMIDRCDSMRLRYRTVVAEVAPLLADRIRSIERLERGERKLRPALEALGEEALRAHDELVSGLRERLIARAEALPSLVAEPDPVTLAIAPDASLPLNEWYAAMDDEARATVTSTDGVWSIVVRPPVAAQPAEPETQASEEEGEPSQVTTASVRTGVLLARGDYEIALECETTALRGDRESASATLMSSLGESTSPAPDQRSWQTLRIPITVREDRRRVDVAIELRAVEGSVSMRGGVIRRRGA